MLHARAARVPPSADGRGRGGGEPAARGLPARDRRAAPRPRPARPRAATIDSPCREEPPIDGQVEAPGVPGRAGGASAAAASTRATKKPFTVDVMWAVQARGRCRVLSPDGTQVAYTVSVVRRGGEPLQRATCGWLRWPAARRAGSPRNKASDGSPGLEPGRHGGSAFVSRRDGDTAAQLYVLPLDGGEAERVTEMPLAVSSPELAARRQAHRLRVQRDRGRGVAGGDEEGAGGAREEQGEGARDARTASSASGTAG